MFRGFNYFLLIWLLGSAASLTGCLPLYTPEDDSFVCVNQDYESDEDVPKIFVYPDHVEKVLSKNAGRNKRCKFNNSQFKIILYNYSGSLCNVVISQKNGQTTHFGDIFDMTNRVLVSESFKNNAESDEIEISISLSSGKRFSEKWLMGIEKEARTSPN